jgi:GMP synthase (glutamine-hydrolysing)
MRRFLLLQARPEAIAADNEYESFLKFTRLDNDRLQRINIANGLMADLNPGDYAGIFLGGGPYNVSDPPDKKSLSQRRYEMSLTKLVERVVALDSPFLAACGIGVIVQSRGGVVSRKYGEQVGALQVSLTDKGIDDKLLMGVAKHFKAFGGHKEACERLPVNAVLLGTSTNCPVQMFKFGQNVYATQFHSELDAAGLALRIQIYKNAGYFAPEAADDLIAESLTHQVTEPVKILRNFVEVYG